jgi:hypothetical protein
MADFVPDSIYDHILLGEKNKLHNAQLQYGTYDPATGQWIGGQAQGDLSKDTGFGEFAEFNPFNQLKTLNRYQGITRNDNMNNAAEMGNLNSGGYAARRDNLNWDQLAAQNALSSSYTRQLAAIGQQGLAAQTDYDSAEGVAWGDALGRKLQWDADHPAPKPGDPDYVPPGGWAPEDGQPGSQTKIVQATPPKKKPVTMKGIPATKPKKTTSLGLSAPSKVVGVSKSIKKKGK